MHPIDSLSLYVVDTWRTKRAWPLDLIYYRPLGAMFIYVSFSKRSLSGLRVRGPQHPKAPNWGARSRVPPSGRHTQRTPRTDATARRMPRTDATVPRSQALPGVNHVGLRGAAGYRWIPVTTRDGDFRMSMGVLLRGLGLQNMSMFE